MKKQLLAGALAVVMTLTFCSCGGAAQSTAQSAAQSGTQGGGNTGEFERASFLPQTEEESLDFTPSVAPYTVAQDFSNVINYNNMQYAFTDEAKQMLLQNGFVVMDGYDEEFFGMYETNRYSYTPSFITADSMMHIYHLYFSRLLKGIEKQSFLPDLTEISSVMQQASVAQYEALKGTAWENAALRNAAFFSVALSLISGTAQAPDAVKDVVNQELALIEAAVDIVPSPVMNLGADTQNATELLQEDYSQYIPRGYYTASEELTRYFKAMMWYGRLTFRQSDEDQSRSALLLTSALQNSPGAKEKWEKIYTVTSFFVGASDDAGFYEYANAVTAAYGGMPDAAALPKQEKEWQAFAAAIKKLEPPAINSIPIFDEELQPDKAAAINGFRFMGQRFTLDAAIFQQLVYRAVKENAAGERRMLPSALDVPAALGSATATELLTQQGAADYKGYTENLAKLQDYLKDAPASLWSSSLYAGWVNTLRPLTAEKGEGYPQFMQNKAWAAKSLNTFLGSWTELKHDTVLYAKQVYAEMGGGPIDEVDDRGYVEPEVLLYKRLSALAQATADGLAHYGVLQDTDKENLQRMTDLANQLCEISKKELQDQLLSDDEYELIRTYGGQLEHFWYEALKDEKNGEEITTTDFPAAVVTDVATDPNGSVLEVGSGRVDTIYVLVNVDGALRIAKGGVYSFYEFEQPIAERLTDETWRQMLGIDMEFGADGMLIDRTVDVPRPAWTSLFRTPLSYG